MENSSIPQFRRDRIEEARKAAQQPTEHPATEHQPGDTHNQQGYDKEANDAAAWKGRLTKTQEELRLEREERNRATIEALTAQNKAKEAEERAARAQQELEDAKKRLSEYSQKERENFLSDEEKKQLSDTFGEDATDLLTKIISKARPATPPVDVNDVIEKRFQDMNVKTLEKEWAHAVKTEIPEAHILRADQDFIQFAQGKKDWFGNTALSVMDDIGNKRDVSRISFIKDLINEFKSQNSQGSSESTEYNATVPPRNSNPTYTRQNDGRKKKVSSEEFQFNVNSYKLKGDTKGLRNYLAEHEESL